MKIDYHKIALVQPRIPAGKSLGIEKSPESIQALAGQLEKEGYLVKMFHSAAGTKLYREIITFAPEVVGISTMTPNFLQGKEIAGVIKQDNPKTKIILGGWHASGAVQAYVLGQESETLTEILNPDSPFDFLISGEGELALSQLLKYFRKGQDPSNLSGIGFWADGKITLKPATRIKNLDQLGFPSWNNLPVDDYRDKRTGSLDLSVHFNRACRFSCGYCSTASVYGKSVRTVTAKRAVQQLEDILEKFHPQVITFTDEDFFADPKWVKELVEMMEQKRLQERFQVGFDTFASVYDLAKLEEKQQSSFLARMKKVGFNSFTIGIESMNPKILQKYNKERMILPLLSQSEKEKHEQGQKLILVKKYYQAAARAIDFVQKQGLLIVGDYIIGNLGECPTEVKEGFAKFTALPNLFLAYIPVYTPFPGTILWKEAYDSNKIIRDTKGHIDWSKFNASTGALELGYNVEGLRNELELKFYTNQGYRKDMLRNLEIYPQRRNMFLSRFNYLQHLFPENKLVKDRIKELER